MDDVNENDWSSPAGETFAQLWAHDPGSVRFWRISSNAACTVDVNGQRHFLRFNLAEERSLPEVEAEIRILLALAEGPVRAAQPIPSLKGRFVESSVRNGDLYHIVLFEALPGEHPEADGLDAEACFRWGSELGLLHAQFAAMPPQTFEGRGDWVQDLERMRHFLQAEEAGIRLRLEQAAAAMRLLCESAPAVPIHFDFETDNLLRHGESVALGVIDFDDCRSYPPGADIEFAIGDLREGLAHELAGNEGFTLSFAERISQFLHGYADRSPYPLPSDDDLRLLRTWHDLYRLAVLNRSLGGGSEQTGAPWQAALAQRLDAKRYRLRVSLNS